MRSKSLVLLLLLMGAPAFADAASDIDEAGTPPEATSQNTHEEFIRPHASYKDVSPQIAFALALAPNAFSGHQLAPGQSGLGARGLELQIDYQPSFFQGPWGLFDFGVFAAMYPINSSLFSSISTGVTSSIFSVWEPGVQVRYQARLFKEQILVPTLAYSVSSLRYHFVNGDSGTLTNKGGTLGLWLYLNALSPSAGEVFYDDWSAARSYLIAEARSVSGIAGTSTTYSAFFGIRVEF